MTVESRVIMATTVLSGNAICDSNLPAARELSSKVYLTISVFTSPSEVISKVAAGVAGGFSVSLSLRAIYGMAEPCMVAEMSTTKKTTLKMSSAPGRPNTNGKIAKIIGTEPRKPTQETSVISRRLKPKMAKNGATAKGRATNTKTLAISKPSSQTSSNESTFTNRPNITNMVIWLSQAKPSWKIKVLRWNTKRVLPIMTPAMNMDRKPLPPSVAAAPKASKPKAVTITG